MATHHDTTAAKSRKAFNDKAYQEGRDTYFQGAKDCAKMIVVGGVILAAVGIGIKKLIS
jgi:hypothetical protein